MADAPILTMPEPEAALLAATYAKADVILEYGSGGSTLVAAERAGTTVFAVESDRAWYQMMTQWFFDNPPPVPVQLHHVNLGPTGRWGFPRTKVRAEHWPRYALSVWDRPDFQHPDVVLVDGRFRLACMLTVALRITRPVTLLCDDYLERKEYHKIETLIGAPDMTGRMAAFTLTPQSFPVAEMGWIIAAYSTPG